jgi:hypothetical protein
LFKQLFISSNYIFKGLPFETLGPWCKETIDFINVIGKRLSAESGDSKSKKFLFERISLAIQRGNAASIRGTFPDSALLPIENFYKKYIEINAPCNNFYIFFHVIIIINYCELSTKTH